MIYKSTLNDMFSSSGKAIPQYGNDALYGIALFSLSSFTNK
jgi:hypothetical protein